MGSSIGMSTDYTGSLYDQRCIGCIVAGETPGIPYKVSMNTQANSSKMDGKQKSKQQQKKKVPDSSSSSKSRSVSISSKEMDLIRQITTPEISRGGSAMMAPSPVIARGQAVHYRLEQVIDNIADNTTICVKPTQYPVSITAQSSISEEDIYFFGEMLSNGFFKGEVFAGESTGDDYVLKYLLHTAEIFGRSAVPLTVASPSTINAGGSGWPPGKLELSVYDSNTNNWIAIGAFNGFDGTPSGIPVPAGLAVQAISVENLNGPPGLVEYGLLSSVDEFTTTLVSSAHAPVHLQLPEGTERYRVTALSVKGTFFGSSLNNQGEIAIARTYPGWTPFDSQQDPWDVIAQLPYQSYDGRLETGVHGFWLPTNMAELDFRNVNEEFTSLDLTRFWIAVKGADPTASLRVELDMVIEFYSPRPYFSKDATPYFNDRSGHLLYLLSQETGVGDNPGHLARLASIGKKVAMGVKTAGEIASIFV